MKREEEGEGRDKQQKVRTQESRVIEGGRVAGEGEGRHDQT